MPLLSPTLTHLVVKNIEISRSYYESVLGFHGSLTDDGSAVKLTRSHTEVVLVEGSASGTIGLVSSQVEKPSAYIWVSEFDSLFEEFDCAGADIVYPPTEHSWGVIDFCVRDSDGYRICFAKACLSGSFPTVAEKKRYSQEPFRKPKKGSKLTLVRT